MFERFTEKAIKAIMLAQEEARRLEHNFVGTEQILLGLIGEGSNSAGWVLNKAGVNLENARQEVENIIGRGQGAITVEIPFTARAKQSLQHAWEAARAMCASCVKTEHLLLGILEVTDSVALKVLHNLGVDLNQLRSSLISLTNESQKTSSVGKAPSPGMTFTSQPASLQICPNCAESTRESAIMCRFCGLGLSLEYYKKCPICAEMIRKDATKCRFCSTTC